MHSGSGFGAAVGQRRRDAAGAVAVTTLGVAQGVEAEDQNTELAALRDEALAVSPKRPRLVSFTGAGRDSFTLIP